MRVEVGQIWRDKRGDEVVVESIDSKLITYSFKHKSGEADKAYYTVEGFVKHHEFVRNKGDVGVKADSNKRRYSLLPSGVVNQVVDVLEFGSQKYADNNWQKVDNARTRYYNAALRHIDAWWGGEIKDSETGKHHLAHAICCLMFLVWFDGVGND